MKILFLSPTWTDDLGIFSRIAKKRNSQPPLGILYLARIAENSGHFAEVIDADVEDLSFPGLVQRISDGKYDIIGITATSPIFHKAVSIAGELKKKGFAGKILIGGEHVNIFKEKAFQDSFDFAFYGESDNSFRQFLDLTASGGKDYSSIKGLIYRYSGRVVVNPPAERIIDLDTLVTPAMHMLKLDRYVMSFARYKSRRYLPVMISRGCPFKCVFCSEPLTNPVVRFRSPRNVVDEMEKHCKELGIRHFFFMDSNLTLKRPVIEGMCEELIKRKLDITWEGWTRANLVDENILRLMKKAGLIRISYGIESGDPEILKIIKKEVSLDDMRKAFRLTEKAGIEAACSLMIGLPGETRESIERTIKFVNSIPEIRYTNLSIANPYPGTELYSWAKEGKYGIHLMIKDFSEYRRYDHSPISVNDLSPEDLVRLQVRGLIRLHLKVKRILAAARMLGLRDGIAIFLKMVFSAFKKRKTA